MNALIETFAGYSAAAAAGLVAAAWQGVLLALAVAVVLRAFPGLSAAARSVVWWAVFGLIALLHLAPLVGQFGARSGAGFGAAGWTAVHLSPWWAAAIGLAWVVLAVARAGQLAMAAWHVRKIVGGAVAVPVGEEISPLLQVGRRRVELATSDAVARPCVVGFWRPRILMPPEVLSALSEAELRQIVVHEMEHLRRRDDWSNLLQKVGLVLFPLNPALAWVERRLCAERELACDDGVIAAGAGRKAYAQCLARLAEFALLRQGYGLMLGAWERRPELVRRVQRILSQPGHTLGRRSAGALTGGLVAAAVLGGVWLSRVPQVVNFGPVASTVVPGEVGAAATLARAGLVGLDRDGLGRAALARDAVARAAGGRPELVRAVMPAGPVARAAAVKRRKQGLDRSGMQDPSPMEYARLAELRENAAAGEGTLLVMTSWSSGDGEFVVRQFQSVMPGRRELGSGERGRARVVEAVYLVPTPDGWLVVKI